MISLFLFRPGNGECNAITITVHAVVVIVRVIFREVNVATWCQLGTLVNGTVDTVAVKAALDEAFIHKFQFNGVPSPPHILALSRPMPYPL